MSELESIDTFQAQAGGSKKLPNATAVLVLGILSLVFCFCIGFIGFVLAIIALVLHKKDKEMYLTNPKAYDASFKNSKAGFICALIGLILNSFSVIWFIIAISSGNSVYNFNY